MAEKSGLIILPKGFRKEPKELESERIARWAKEAGRPQGDKSVQWCEYHKGFEKRLETGPICNAGMDELRAQEAEYRKKGVPVGNRARGWDMVKRVVKAGPAVTVGRA